MTSTIDQFLKDLPPMAVPGPMPGEIPSAALSRRLVRVLYLHGPCSLETAMSHLKAADYESITMALKGLGAEVVSQPVSLPGRGEAVLLYRLRGGGIG